MGRLLYNLHQDREQRWLWFGVLPGTDYMVRSRRSWAFRSQAEQALTRFLELLARLEND